MRWSTLVVMLGGIAGVLAGCAASAAQAPTYTNPVYRHDFPDPFVLKVGRTYYAYGTNVGLTNLPVLRSRDLVHWKGPEDAMPAIASWAEPVNIWAPSVVKARTRLYVLYYAAPDRVSGKQCIGVAVSSSPVGPFRDTEKRPFICPTSEGGAIDPAVFRDHDGKLYLYWKNDGNCCGLTTHIYVQQLASNGASLLSAPQSLAVDDQRWEGEVIEGPAMWRHGGTYYLFYSGGQFDTAGYAVGYSTCESARGPCQDYRGNPVLRSRCKASGPGGETIVRDERGRTWMLYHAWLSNAVNRAPGRLLWLDRLVWTSSGPRVLGPTCSPQRSP